jgi:hypothetical protein
MPRTSPFMATVMMALDEPSGRESFVERAYKVKMYLCIPDGGHGPSYAVVPLVLEPSVPVVEADPSAIEEVFGSILKATQWSQTPTGASGSSRTSARDLVPAGTPEILRGGLISLPLHVYLTGIIAPSANAGLVNLIEDLLSEDIDDVYNTATIIKMVQAVTK